MSTPAIGLTMFIVVMISNMFGVGLDCLLVLNNWPTITSRVVSTHWLAYPILGYEVLGGYRSCNTLSNTINGFAVCLDY